MNIEKAKVTARKAGAARKPAAKAPQPSKVKATLIASVKRWFEFGRSAKSS
jgi:hypothetical protein